MLNLNRVIKIGSTRRILNFDPKMAAKSKYRRVFQNHLFCIKDLSMGKSNTLTLNMTIENMEDHQNMTSDPKMAAVMGERPMFLKVDRIPPKYCPWVSVMR